jgi:4-hydroxyphenylpyruvate dioxygenase and related hemolysins
MKVIGVEHIGIAIKDLEKDAPFWSKVLGIEQTKTEDVDDQGVITDIYDTGRGKIELLLSKYPDSPIGKFLKKRGPGIHHICLQVEDIEESIEDLKKPWYRNNREKSR